MAIRQEELLSELLENQNLAVSQARKQLVDFSIATNAQYIPNWHHDVIAQQLEHIEAFADRDYKILMVFVPPRHGKSQQCSIDFPAWFLGRNPTQEIITASYSGELAQDFGSKTREKVNSPEYRLIFPEVTLKEDEQSRAKWRTKQGGSYTSVGVGGTITGRGANILLIDDPIKNREEAESEIYRNKVFDWFTSTAFTRLEPNGVVVIILTRWHLDDLVGRILQNQILKHRTKIIQFPAIATQREIHRDQGQPLWPERYNLKALEEIKSTVGPYDWQSLYQGSPILSENQEFRTDWIRKIAGERVDLMNCRRFLTVDTAMSKKTAADFTGFVDNRVNDQNYWHLKAWRMKLGPEELIDALFTLHQKNHYETIGIEKTQYSIGLKPFLDSEQRKRNTFLPIVELEHHDTKKEIRIRALIPRYASKSIFHIENECNDLEEEMLTFPNAVHDDVLDSLAYQLQIADGAKSAGVSVSVRDYD